MNTTRLNQLSYAVIGAAIAVHRELGPGLEETDYEPALSAELAAAGIDHNCQHPVPVVYKNVHLDAGYRIDVLVENSLVVELKSVEIDVVVAGQLPLMIVSVAEITPLLEARLLGRLRNGGWKTGLLLNFSEKTLGQGVRRLFNPNWKKR